MKDDARVHDSDGPHQYNYRQKALFIVIVPIRALRWSEAPRRMVRRMKPHGWSSDNLRYRAEQSKAVRGEGEGEGEGREKRDRIEKKSPRRLPNETPLDAASFGLLTLTPTPFWIPYQDRLARQARLSSVSIPHSAGVQTAAHALTRLPTTGVRRGVGSPAPSMLWPSPAPSPSSSHPHPHPHPPLRCRNMTQFHAAHSRCCHCWLHLLLPLLSLPQHFVGSCHCSTLHPADIVVTCSKSGSIG